MKGLILVTGGARSGKSHFAESLVKDMGQSIGYIATSIPFDEGMKDRIKKHRQSRPKEWMTIERYKDFHQLEKDPPFQALDTILLDCITLMVSNILLEEEKGKNWSREKIDLAEAKIMKEVEGLLHTVGDKNTVLVTNEIGMGVVPSYPLGNIFRDIAGRVNQYLARQAQEVYFAVSGIPMKIK